MTRDLLTPLWTSATLPTLAPRDWELLLAQARSARLMGRLAHLFETRGALNGVPDAPARHLQSALRIANRLHHDVLFEVDQLQTALHALPTPIVLLKGAAYVAAELPPARGRLFSDVDVLVRRDQLDAVERALFAAGWMPEKLTPYDDRYYRKWMHELPPLQHVQRRTCLDVHHTITPPTSRFAIDATPLLARCQPLAGAPRLSVLAPVDMVLHSTVHLLQEGDFGGGLRDLLDLNDLIQLFGSQTACTPARQPGFWPELVQRASELGLATPLSHVLAQAERLFGTIAPPGPAAELLASRSAAPGWALTQALLTVVLRPQHPSCDSWATALARQMLYMRSHWLRMPWYQIAPHLVRKSFKRAVARLQARHEPAAQAGV